MVVVQICLNQKSLHRIKKAKSPSASPSCSPKAEFRKKTPRTVQANNKRKHSAGYRIWWLGKMHHLQILLLLLVLGSVAQISESWGWFSSSAVSQAELDNAGKEGMEMISESYENIKQEMDKLKNETHKINTEINKLVDSMLSRMSDLQSKADDIGAATGISLDMQQKLLDDQSVALKGTQSVPRFPLEDLEESR